ncbi:MAG: hypothetical protein V4689_17680 [Verrucomicrobiota bacterium]
MIDYEEAVARQKQLIAFGLRLTALGKSEDVCFKSRFSDRSYKVIAVDVIEGTLRVELQTIGPVGLTMESITPETFFRPACEDPRIVPPWLGGESVLC